MGLYFRRFYTSDSSINLLIHVFCLSNLCATIRTLQLAPNWSLRWSPWWRYLLVANKSPCDCMQSGPQCCIKLSVHHLQRTEWLITVLRNVSHVTYRTYMYWISHPIAGHIAANSHLSALPASSMATVLDNKVVQQDRHDGIVDSDVSSGGELPSVHPPLSIATISPVNSLEQHDLNAFTIRVENTSQSDDVRDIHASFSLQTTHVFLTNQFYLAIRNRQHLLRHRFCSRSLILQVSLSTHPASVILRLSKR